MARSPRWLPIIAALSSLLTAACASAPAPRPEKPLDTGSEAAFTASVALRIEHRLQQHIIVAGPLVLLLESRAMQLSLGRLWRACQSDAASCEPEVARYVVGVGEVLGPREATRREALVAVLRSSEYLAAAKGAIINEPFAGDMRVVLLVDSPNTTRSADDDDLKALGLDPLAALALGKENIARFAGHVADQVKPVGDGQIGMLGGHSFYASSLLLDVVGWKAVASRQPGYLLAAVPAPDMLMYKWVESREEVLAFVMVVDHVVSSAPRALSRTILKWTGDGWEALEPTPAPAADAATR